MTVAATVTAAARVLATCLMDDDTMSIPAVNTLLVDFTALPVVTMMAVITLPTDRTSEAAAVTVAVRTLPINFVIAPDVLIDAVRLFAVDLIELASAEMDAVRNLPIAFVAVLVADTAADKILAAVLVTPPDAVTFPVRLLAVDFMLDAVVDMLAVNALIYSCAPAISCATNDAAADRLAVSDFAVDLTAEPVTVTAADSALAIALVTEDDNVMLDVRFLAACLALDAVSEILAVSALMMTLSAVNVAVAAIDAVRLFAVCLTDVAVADTSAVSALLMAFTILPVAVTVADITLPVDLVSDDAAVTVAVRILPGCLTIDPARLTVAVKTFAQIGFLTMLPVAEIKDDRILPADLMTVPVAAILEFRIFPADLVTDPVADIAVDNALLIALVTVDDADTDAVITLPAALVMVAPAEIVAVNTLDQTGNFTIDPAAETAEDKTLPVDLIMDPVAVMADDKAFAVALTIDPVKVALAVNPLAVALVCVDDISMFAVKFFPADLVSDDDADKLVARAFTHVSALVIDPTALTVAVSTLAQMDALTIDPVAEVVAVSFLPVCKTRLAVAVMLAVNDLGVSVAADSPVENVLIKPSSSVPQYAKMIYATEIATRELYVPFVSSCSSDAVSVMLYDPSSVKSTRNPSLSVPVYASIKCVESSNTRLLRML